MIAYGDGGGDVCVDFSLRVYHDRNVPVFAQTVQAADRLEKRDDRTFDVYWRQPYSLANQLTYREFTVLPRHILQPILDQGPEAFVNASYWGDSFVGAGPFRVQSWQRGSHIELAAFDHYFLGKPRTEQVVVRFIADQNTVIAQLLAGELDLTVGGVETPRSVELEPRIRDLGLGQFTYGGNSYSYWTFQYNNHPGAVPFRDARVRRAMAYGLDRVQLAEYATLGRSPVLDSWIRHDEARYKDAEPYMTKYPFDPQRSTATFQEAGWTRGADGMLRNASAQTLPCVIRGAESVGTLGVQMWKAAGIDASEEPIPTHLTRNPEWRATFQCVESSSRNVGISKVVHLQSSNAMSAANGWRGNNRAGWSSPESDRLIDWFTTTLVERERLQAERDLIKVLTSELPLLPMYMQVEPVFLSAGLTGWRGHKRGILPDGSTSWNAHEWEKR